jgi:hypothetical protein
MRLLVHGKLQPSADPDCIAIQSILHIQLDRLLHHAPAVEMSHQLIEVIVAVGLANESRHGQTGHRPEQLRGRSNPSCSKPSRRAAWGVGRRLDPELMPGANAAIFHA